MVDSPQKAVIFQLGSLHRIHSHQRILCKGEQILGIKIAPQRVQCRKHQRKYRDGLHILPEIKEERDIIFREDILNCGQIRVDLSGNEGNLIICKPLAAHHVYDLRRSKTHLFIRVWRMHHLNVPVLSFSLIFRLMDAREPVFQKGKPF